jgi:hypothetical protein
MWKIWWAPNNASKWQMGLNSAFKGLISVPALQHNSALNYLLYAPPPVSIHTLILPSLIPQHFSLHYQKLLWNEYKWNTLAVESTTYMPRSTDLCLLHHLNWFQLATTVSQRDHQGWPNYQLLDNCLSQWPYQQLTVYCWYSCPVH